MSLFLKTSTKIQPPFLPPFSVTSFLIAPRHNFKLRSRAGHIFKSWGFTTQAQMLFRIHRRGEGIRSIEKTSHSTNEILEKFGMYRESTMLTMIWVLWLCLLSNNIFCCTLLNILKTDCFLVIWVKFILGILTEGLLESEKFLLLALNYRQAKITCFFLG